ncbi:OLC1v1013229C1 [Oldenlandia corymbosa var. corymbosa]|uniref:OLC1v1013229C1 n=1 Tax=Oldenlandia corymbosa var. corymbosa TaxID=529605 RepID=A0AAV1DZU1_OLDCO|nr:OLC1v1013229C1 [Oldenlandia corymbosa var. corymbosa]
MAQLVGNAEQDCQLQYRPVISASGDTAASVQYLDIKTIQSCETSQAPLLAIQDKSLHPQTTEDITTTKAFSSGKQLSRDRKQFWFWPWKTVKSRGDVERSPPCHDHITVDKLIEFPYEELAKATCDFSSANKISEGILLAVYHSELRGKKVAIKKLGMESSKEFLTELRVLSHIHHQNLVSGFGLTTITEARGLSSLKRLMRTFGYMPPDYAQYSEVSPKVEVYTFGIVLYELISAKQAIIKEDSITKSLVHMFEEIFSLPDPNDGLCKLVDPRLGDNYPFRSVLKMAQLARACTRTNPHMRPSIRSVVVSLTTTTVSSSIEE